MNSLISSFLEYCEIIEYSQVSVEFKKIENPLTTEHYIECVKKKKKIEFKKKIYILNVTLCWVLILIQGNYKFLY